MKMKALPFLLSACLLFASAGCSAGNKGSSGTESTGGAESTSGESASESQPTEGAEVIDLNTLVEELSKDYYSKNIKTSEKLGLSDPTVVGADEKKMNENRYPVPADGEFALVCDVTEKGITPDAKDNSASLNALLASLKGIQGLKKIVFPAGIYRFSSAIELKGLSDLYLSGEGDVEFLMTEWTEAVEASDCENLHFNGIDFDYETSSTVTGTVVSADDAAGQVTILVNDEFDMTDYRYNGGKIAYGNYMEFVRDARTGDYYPDVNGMLRYNSTGDRVNMISNGVYDPASRRLTLTFASGYYKRPAAGTVVSVGYTMYEHYTLHISSTKNLYLEDCNVYASVGMTFGFYSCENVYMNRADIVLKEGSSRLMTATADGLHTNDCFGDLIVSNCIIENTHDDAINVCTFYKTVSSVSGSVITCNAPNAAANFPTEIGDVIEVFDQTMTSVQKYTVKDVASYGLVYEITVDKRVKNVGEGYLVGNLTRTPALTVENCVFRNKRNRGILCQTQNSVIRNCTFYNVIHGSVSLHSAFDGFFNEGLIPRDVTVENCKFVNSGGTQAGADVYIERIGGTVVPGCITGIVVRNNFFHGNFKWGVSFVGAGDCEMSDNLFYNDRREENSLGYALARISLSQNVTVKDNYVFFPYEREVWKMTEESDSAGTVVVGNRVSGALTVQ